MSRAELESLGRRAVACAGWRNNARLQWLPVSRPATLVEYRWQEAQYSAAPDFSDPLTVGWLLALVREKHGACTGILWVPDVAKWVVFSGTGAPIATGATEAAALVAALEVQNG